MIRMVKDKNKPKGPMSAYACFVQVIREEHKKKHPEESVVFSEFSKKCAEKWKTMTDKEKQRFDDMASRDKERYVREMDSYVPPDGMKKPRKRRRNKDPGQPKRALSAFFFFCEEKRPAVRAEHPDWKVGDIAKDLGRQWEICQCKGKYEGQAMADKSRYEREMIEYRNGTFTITKRARLEDVVSGETVGMTAAGNGYPLKQENALAMYNMTGITPQISTQTHGKPEVSSEVPTFDNQVKPELSASGSRYNLSNSNDAVPHPAAFGHQNFNPPTQPTPQTQQPSLVTIQPQNYSGIMPQDLTASTQSQSQLQHNPVPSQTLQQSHQPNVSHDISMMQPRVTPGGDTADIAAERNGGSVNRAAGISQESNEELRSDCAVDDDDEEDDDIADE